MRALAVIIITTALLFSLKITCNGNFSKGSTSFALRDGYAYFKFWDTEIKGMFFSYLKAKVDVKQSALTLDVYIKGNIGEGAQYELSLTGNVKEVNDNVLVPFEVKAKYPSELDSEIKSNVTMVLLALGFVMAGIGGTISLNDMIIGNGTLFISGTMRINNTNVTAVLNGIINTFKNSNFMLLMYKNRGLMNGYLVAEGEFKARDLIKMIYGTDVAVRDVVTGNIKSSNHTFKLEINGIENTKEFITALERKLNTTCSLS